MSRRQIIELSLVTGLGAVLRGWPVLSSDFPLNDGGLFLLMVESVRDDWPALPTTIEYNTELIPFAYPPLGFYLSAAWMWITGQSGLDTLRSVPLILSVATVTAAYLLFRRLLESDLLVFLSAAAFALIPRGFEFTVSGGGITRALGYLLAVLTLWAAARWLDRATWRSAGIAGLLLAATGLSHPQTGVFAAVSIVVLAAFRGRPYARRWRQLAGLMLVAAAGVLPWLAVVLSRHGIETILGAVSTGGSATEGLLLLAGLRFSNGLFEVLGILGVFGLVIAAANRQWLFPVWMAVTVLVSSRAGLNYAAIILSIGVAFGVAYVLQVLLGGQPRTLGEAIAARVGVVFLVVVGALGFADSAASPIRAASPLRPLDAEAREAFTWIRTETPPDSVVLVLSGTGWFIDAPSEWLPALTGRRSSATVQGSEWAGPGVFAEKEQRFVWLQSCAAQGRADCVSEWERAVESIDYVLAVESEVASSLGRQCCLASAQKVADSGGHVVYESSSAIVVVPPETPAE